MLFTLILFSVMPKVVFILFHFMMPWFFAILPALALMGWFLFGFVAGWKRLEVKYITYSSPDLPPYFDGYKILHFSDFHLGTFPKGSDFVKQVVERANAEGVEMMLFTGDLVNNAADEVEPYVEDLKKLQKDADYLIRYHTEQAKSSVSASDVDMAGVRAEYSYAAAMAQCCHVLKNEAGAAVYLKQAQTAYQTAVRSRSRTDMVVSPEQYMAATALFNVTGSYSYHQVIKQYEAAEDTAEGFWGDLLYLTSLQRVDTKLCEQQMNRLLKECGELSDNVFSQHAIESRADSLTAMLKLAVADNTLVSLEYRNACKILLHACYSNMEEMDCVQRSALLFIEGELAKMGKESEDKE